MGPLIPYTVRWWNCSKTITTLNWEEHQQWLIEYIESHPDFVTPEYRRNEVLGFLKNQTLEDLCISRPQSRLSWGIPLPFDPDYVTYVWFDALTNYASIPASMGDPALPGFGKAPDKEAALLALQTSTS